MTELQPRNPSYHLLLLWTAVKATPVSKAVPKPNEVAYTYAALPCKQLSQDFANSKNWLHKSRKPWKLEERTKERWDQGETRQLPSYTIKRWNKQPCMPTGSLQAGRFWLTMQTALVEQEHWSAKTGSPNDARCWSFPSITETTIS